MFFMFWLYHLIFHFYLSTHLFPFFFFLIFLFIFFYVNSFFFLSFFLSSFLSLFIYLFLSVCLSFFLSVFLSFFLSVFLSFLFSIFISHFIFFTFVIYQWYSFAFQNSNLLAHMTAVHSATRPFVCLVKGCGQSFGFKHVLQRHHKNIHIDGKVNIIHFENSFLNHFSIIIYQFFLIFLF